MPADRDPRAAAARLIEGWNSRDAEAVAACYAPDAAYREMALWEALRGRPAIRNSMQMYLNALPDIHVESRRVLADGDSACEEWTVTATHQGDLLGLAATGRTVEVALCHVLTCGADGLISDDVFYWDLVWTSTASSGRCRRSGRRLACRRRGSATSGAEPRPLARVPARTIVDPKDDERAPVAGHDGGRVRASTPKRGRRSPMAGSRIERRPTPWGSHGVSERPQTHTGVVSC